MIWLVLSGLKRNLDVYQMIVEREGATELLIAGTAPRDLMICDILSGALR